MRDEDFQYQRKEEDLIICEYWAQNGRCRYSGERSCKSGYRPYKK
jgi:hypothetical protein